MKIKSYGCLYALLMCSSILPAEEKEEKRHVHFPQQLVAAAVDLGRKHQLDLSNFLDLKNIKTGDTIVTRAWAPLEQPGSLLYCTVEGSNFIKRISEDGRYFLYTVSPGLLTVVRVFQSYNPDTKHKYPFVRHSESYKLTIPHCEPKQE